NKQPLPELQPFVQCDVPIPGRTVEMRLVARVPDSALLVTSPPLDKRLFVVQQHGAIHIIEEGVVRPQPFLDLSEDNDGPVVFGVENGLLGLAFHPQYATTGMFFVTYTQRRSGDPDNDQQNVLARCTTSADPNRADRSSCVEVLVIPDLAGNHNGGMIEFGADVSSITAIRRVRDLAWIDYLVIVGYFALLAGIGWYFSHQKESSSEYSLGGRKIQWWAAGISMFATGASAISFMAIPALAFATNLVWTLPILIYVAGYFVQAHIIFPLLRRLQITSTYEYLEQRFNVPLRLIASGQAILFLTFGRAAVVLVLPAIAIAITTGLNVFISVLVMGALTTVYTAIGGYKAVIWTEVFQGVLKFLAPIAMIGVVIWALPGGFKEFISVGKEYHKFDIALITWDVTVPALWIMVLGAFIACTVSLAGDQPMIQRVFSAPEHEVRRVAFMNVLCGILISFVVNILGLAIFAFFRAHPGLLDAGTQNDQIVPLFATQGLPAGLAGVVIAAIFASAMATVASNMNSVSTLFVEDFYVRWRPEAPDARRLFVLKFSAYLVGAIGTVMALLLAALPIKSMMVVWSQVSALLGGGIVGVYTLGMLTTRANGVGAVSGAVASVLVALSIKLFTPLHWSTYLPIAIGSCLVVGYVVSLLTPHANKKNLTGLTVFTPRS
ncbi:MAG: sodium/solute symporter, partial [Burkholderiales bacterium]|nr:sodium/solute symporter [Opitutaceae bacterium]